MGNSTILLHANKSIVRYVVQVKAQKNDLSAQFINTAR